MKMKHYLSLPCERLYADQLLSDVNQTRISKGELRRTEDKVLLESEN